MPKPKPNSKPVINPQSFSILESAIGGALVGGIIATDADAGDTLTYSIVSGNVGNVFTINPTTGVLSLATGKKLDYETLDSYALVVSVSDGKSSSSGTVTITVGDVNEAPNDILLNTADASNVATVAPGADGAVIGLLTAVDPDAGGSHIFSIDDGRFEVIGGQLKLKTGESLALGEPATINVTVTDQGGLDHSKTFTIVAANPPPFSGEIHLNQLAASDGFRIIGEAGSTLGYKATPAGDMNGDGFADFALVSADKRDVYVIFGHAGTPLDFSTIRLTDPATWDGILLEGGQPGVPGAFYFASLGDPPINFAGDVNGDGFDDLIMTYEVNGSSGQTFVLFGKEFSQGNTTYTSPPSGADGFVIQGGRWSVGSAGDFNADGVDDLLIGYPGYSVGVGKKNAGFGAAYVVYGADDISNLNLSDVSGTSWQGLRIIGSTRDEGVGYSVASAGDLNGDLFDDVIVNGNGAYVVYGRAGGGGVTDLSLAGLSADDGFHIAGTDIGSLFTGVGDVNGDGYDDVLIAASNADTTAGGVNSGAVYLIFGQGNSSRGEIDLENLVASDGIRFVGADSDDRAGRSISAAGDINGDGIGDILIGAYAADGDGNLVPDAGEAYVIFGRASWAASPTEQVTIDLGNLEYGTGFTIYGAAAGDWAGYAISAVGNINGDINPVTGYGYDDLVISAPLADSGGTNSGEAYVIFGKDFFGAI